MSAPRDKFQKNIEKKRAKKFVLILFTNIARHMIQNNEEIAACICLLKESNDVLEIQDILTYLPEFVKIEHFKEPLCECLKEHSIKIQVRKNFIEIIFFRNYKKK